eukprot:4648487-Karenia_brevis.AAC.1
MPEKNTVSAASSHSTSRHLSFPSHGICGKTGYERHRRGSRWLSRVVKQGTRRLLAEDAPGKH